MPTSGNRTIPRSEVRASEHREIREFPERIRDAARWRTHHSGVGMSARRGGMAPRNAAFPAVVITRLHVRRHPGFRHRDSSPTRCVKATGWPAGQVAVTAGFRPNATRMTPRAFLAMRASRHGLCHAVLHTVTRASTAHPEVTVRQTTPRHTRHPQWITAEDAPVADALRLPRLRFADLSRRC